MLKLGILIILQQKNKDRLNDAIRDLSNAQRDGECLIRMCAK